MGDGTVREFGRNMYSLLYLTRVTSKISAYSTGRAVVPGSLDGRGLGQPGYTHTHGSVPLPST